MTKPTMFNRILVPIDDSDASREAQQLAGRWSRAFGARLRLVHWLDVDAFPNGFGYGQPVIREAQLWADALLRKQKAVLEAEGVPTEMHLIVAHSRRLGDCIREEARDWKAQAIVLGSHGRRGISRALLGSGAEQIVRESPVPVLVVRAAQADALFRRILVAVDGSDSSDHALDVAVQLAAQCGARIRLVHSMGDVAVFGAYGYAGGVLDQVRQQADQMLQQASARVQAAGVEVEGGVSTDDERLGAFVAQQAQDWNADLVVAGTHGRRGWRRAVLGSGAEQIARLAPTSVLLVPGPNAGDHR